MPTKIDGSTDWSKIFMGFAIALVYIIQSYHAMQLEDVKSIVVPRPEIEKHREQVMDKDVILQALKEINTRINRVEANQ